MNTAITVLSITAVAFAALLGLACHLLAEEQQRHGRTRRRMVAMQIDHGKCHAAHMDTARRLVATTKQLHAYEAWFHRQSLVIGEQALADYRDGLADVRRSIEAWERGEGK